MADYNHKMQIDCIQQPSETTQNQCLHHSLISLPCSHFSECNLPEQYNFNLCPPVIIRDFMLSLCK